MFHPAHVGKSYIGGAIQLQARWHPLQHGPDQHPPVGEPAAVILESTFPLLEEIRHPAVDRDLLGTDAVEETARRQILSEHLRSTLPQIRHARRPDYEPVPLLSDDKPVALRPAELFHYVLGPRGRSQPAHRSILERARRRPSAT